MWLCGMECDDAVSCALCLICTMSHAHPPPWACISLPLPSLLMHRCPFAALATQHQQHHLHKALSLKGYH